MTAILAFTLAAAPVMANRAGPHLDGNAYDALRPTGPVPTLEFALDTECLDTDGQPLALPSPDSHLPPHLESMRERGREGPSQVTLGPDFVLARGRNGTVIHDFQFQRILTIGVDGERFSNHSMYGHFRVRWAFLQNKLYVLGFLAGTGAKTKTSFPVGVQRFLVEHAHGVGHPKAMAFKYLPVAPLRLDRQGEMLVASVQGVEVLRTEFGNTVFPSPGHRRSFASWLAWFVKIHPRLAHAIAGEGALPANLQFARTRMQAVMDSSGFPVCNLKVSDVSQAFGRLEELAGLTLNVPAWPPLLPEELVRLMVDAARHQAPVDDAVYVKRLLEFMADGAYLDAALLSLHLGASIPSEGCAAAERDTALCDTITDSLRTAQNHTSVQTLWQALSLSEQEKHGQAAEALVSLRDRSPARPDILEFMIAKEIVKAHSHSQLNDSLKKEFDRLPGTYEAALAIDPYSPDRFNDIAHYLRAAARSVDRAYFAPLFQTLIYDLARALPGGPTLRFLKKTPAVERKIADDFPGLFPKVAVAAE